MEKVVQCIQCSQPVTKSLSPLPEECTIPRALCWPLVLADQTLSSSYSHVSHIDELIHYPHLCHNVYFVHGPTGQ